jgi:type IV pilus assembly protein PilN
MLSELTRQTPEGIYLRAIKQEGNKVNVAGWAASNERVSEYLRNLQNNSPYVERPELIEIKVAGQSPQGVQRRLFEFSLNFFMRPTPERAQLQSGKTAPRPAPAAGAPVAQTAQK